MFLERGGGFAAQRAARGAGFAGERFGALSASILRLGAPLAGFLVLLVADDGGAKIQRVARGFGGFGRAGAKRGKGAAAKAKG